MTGSGSLLAARFDVRRSIASLAVEVPPEVWADVTAKANILLAQHELLLDAVCAVRELLACKSAIENHPGCAEFVNAAAAEDDLLAIMVRHDDAESRWLRAMEALGA